MKKCLNHSPEISLRLDTHYVDFLKEIKSKLEKAQLRTARAVNQALVQFYWELGKEIIEK